MYRPTYIIFSTGLFRPNIFARPHQEVYVHCRLNKNTIKLSYSCMGNIKQSIANHNKTILSKEKIKEEQIKLCNCRNRTLCPLQGNCLQKGVVYQATVTQTNTMREDIYIGITENELKTRYNQHTSSFRLSHKSSTTSLSEHIWKLKENNTDHTVTWKILEKAQPYTPITGKCKKLVHIGEGLYCLHPPFSEQAKRTIFHLPTQEKTSAFKSENNIRRRTSFKRQRTKPQCIKRQCTKTS